MFGTKRLKKKSQSIDISASGYDPLAPAPQQVLQPTKPPPVTNTTTSEEEQNNTANTQRRNPRRGELKRYYTIGALVPTLDAAFQETLDIYIPIQNQQTSEPNDA